MSPSLLRLKRKNARILKITWSLMAVAGVFLIENILVDPLLQKKFVRLPSLVPPPLSIAWLTVFGILSILLAVLLVCLVFVIRHPGIRSDTKIQTGAAIFLTFLLGLFWMQKTAGAPGEAIARAAIAQSKNLPPGHWANLTWKASSSRIAGYNIYRSHVSGSGYTKLNSVSVKELTYFDSSVVPGKTYFYIVKAVDEKGEESAPTNESSATIPK
jgi:hypothetical protein